MKLLYIAACFFALSCNATQEKQAKQVKEYVRPSEPEVINDSAAFAPPDAATPPKVYSNKRFRDVTVVKTSEGGYTIKGQGQIFEANFGWVIEDGHKELKEGFAMTDAGAPEWGNFKFTVNATSIDPNKKLHLILFESSAKDGSRQYELPIPLD